MQESPVYKVCEIPAFAGMTVIRTTLKIYDLRFTIYDLRFTIYDLRFMIYGLRFKIYDLRYTI